MRLYARRVGFMMLALLLAALLVACGGDGASGGDTAPDEEPTTDPAIPEEEPAGAQIGQTAPDFTLTVYENDNFAKDQVVSLSELRGKPVVINFWFPACTQCQELMFLLKDSYNDNKDSVHYVAVQVPAVQRSMWDRGSSEAEGQDYVTDKELHFIVGGDFEGEVAGLYGVDAYPTTFFLDSNLVVVASETYLKGRGIQDAIDAASE